jgi:N6-L-threonylcarbamoyladenine synthase
VEAKPHYILGIESSCDETSAAIIQDTLLLSNVIATQDTIHRFYGGVVPELASRAHQQKIIPVVNEALIQANIAKNELSAVAFTRGPGLMGALLVGVSFAKSMALALDIPLVEVNHMQGHVLAHFIRKQNNPESPVPAFPFLCLTVSGGHTQVVLVENYLKMKVIGETRDDAAGEAFDKAAKIMGLPYPGGVVIDRLAKEGNASAYKFPHPHSPGYDFSFSGLKTAFLNFIREKTNADPSFIDKNKNNICASYQKTIVDILMNKIMQASADTGIRDIAISGGVSANSGLRAAFVETGQRLGWNTFIAPFEFCTDNAAMIAVAAYYKFLEKDFASQHITPLARMPF